MPLLDTVAPRSRIAGAPRWYVPRPLPSGIQPPLRSTEDCRELDTAAGTPGREAVAGTVGEPVAVADAVVTVAARAATADGNPKHTHPTASASGRSGLCISIS